MEKLTTAPAHVQCWCEHSQTRTFTENTHPILQIGLKASQHTITTRPQDEVHLVHSWLLLAVNSHLLCTSAYTFSRHRPYTSLYCKHTSPAVLHVLTSFAGADAHPDRPVGDALAAPAGQSEIIAAEGLQTWDQTAGDRRADRLTGDQLIRVFTRHFNLKDI